MRIRVLLPLCLAVAVHAQSPAQPGRTTIGLRVSTEGVTATEADAVFHAVRAAFQADSAFHVLSVSSHVGGSTYFEFSVEKLTPNAVPVSQTSNLAQFSAVVTCAVENNRRTLRVQITDQRDARVVVDSFVQLPDDQPIATAVEQATRDAARSAAKLLK